MAWVQLFVPAEKKHANRIAAALEELDAAAVTLTDEADTPLYEPPLNAMPIWNETRICGLFDASVNRDAILAALRQHTGLPISEYHFAVLEEQVWERAWMDDFKPVRFGSNLWIIPSWSEVVDPDAVNLRLDPGLAFGTGTHETTALCLEWLDGANLQGKALLDYGCGSGILAVAGLLCGAKTAHGCDIDPQAIDASRKNAKKNHVASQLNLSLASEMPDYQADVLVANILAAPLITLAPTLAGHSKPGSDLVLSGILAQQAEEVIQAYLPWYNILPVVQKGDWVRIDGVRKG